MGRLLVLGVILMMSPVVARADSLADIRAGNTAFSEGRNEAAIQAYGKAILAGDLDPEALAVTFNNRGVAYSETGDFDQAIRDYGKALELRPGDKTAIRNLRIGHSRRAAAEVAAGRYDDALADYGRAVSLEPGHAPSYLHRGQIHLERGDVSLALADFTRARELDPANQEAVSLLGKAQATLAAAAPRPEPVAQAPAPAAPPPEPQAAAPAEPAPPASIAAVEPSLPPAARAAAPPPATAQPAAPKALPTVKVAEEPERQYRATQSVRFREGPGNDYPAIGSLAQGSPVAVVGQSKGWLMIQLKDGRKGFIYQRFLEPVSE